MIPRNVLRETTPLTSGDCFSISSRTVKQFDSPLHYHDEYELTLILNAKGSRRVVGSNIEEIGDADLVFLGPNLYHGWFTPKDDTKPINEVSIKFNKDLLDDTFLKRNQFCLIKNMFNNAQRGILFPKETVISLEERIRNLDQKILFEAVLELLSILHTLSITPNIKLLSDSGFSEERFLYKSRRIEKIFNFLSDNYEKDITLNQIADFTNMPAASFSRFFKRMTGKTFIESLNEIRLGHAARMLADTHFSVSSIAYKCGFNNMSNFNRIFKSKKFCTPKSFRATYMSGRKIYI